MLLLSCQASQKNSDGGNILYYIADPAKENIQFYWRDDNGKPFRSLRNLKNQLEAKDKTLKFAMNAGIYMENYEPLGLYIENEKQHTRLNTRIGYGNFYLQPNGVFYITTNGEAAISPTNDFTNPGNVKFATQSGPIMVINGTINPLLKAGSSNLNIRNGVGILPDGRVVFAISKEQINFYDFAEFFLNLGCQNALYLDGFVSRAYYPGKNWKQLDGDFGAIIAVTE